MGPLLRAPGRNWLLNGPFLAKGVPKRVISGAPRSRPRGRSGGSILGGGDFGPKSATPGFGTLSSEPHLNSAQNLQNGPFSFWVGHSSPKPNYSFRIGVLCMDPRTFDNESGPPGHVIRRCPRHDIPAPRISTSGCPDMTCEHPPRHDMSGGVYQVSDSAI